MAIPLPVCIPAECLICDKATLAKIIPATQVTGPQQQVIQPIAPKTKLVIAKPFVRVGTETRSGGFSMTGGAKSSGNSTSGFQSGLPTGCTKVCAVARPSAIHWRNCSSVTGPYILPSVPISLYMAKIYGNALRSASNNFVKPVPSPAEILNTGTFRFRLNAARFFFATGKSILFATTIRGFWRSSLL